MAVQAHVTFSKSFSGVGAIAGPPYWCAMFNIAVALGPCTMQPALIDIQALIVGAHAAASVNSIDAPENLKRSQVYLFSGQHDSVVAPGVVAKTQDFYRNWVPDSQSVFVNNTPAQHAWITDDYGHDCLTLGAPYINNCSFDMSGSMLRHLYQGSLSQPRGQQVLANLMFFDQSNYVPLMWTLKLLSMGSTGAIYVPTACQKGAQCKLIVVFHGCSQGMSAPGIGDAFIRHSGLNDWAESNNIVVLYPQVAISLTVPYNPMGCWDWWGYTGADYACKLGGQQAMIRNMMQAVSNVFDDETNHTAVI